MLAAVHPVLVLDIDPSCPLKSIYISYFFDLHECAWPCLTCIYVRICALHMYVYVQMYCMTMYITCVHMPVHV